MLQTVKVTGLIVEQQFPVRKYVSLEAAKGDPIFQKDRVLGIELFDGERSIPYALFNSVLEGTIYESVYPYLNLSGIVGGLSREDVFNAYVSRSRVVVEGVAFVVNRNGVDCPCIDVSRIEIFRSVGTRLFHITLISQYLGEIERLKHS